MKKVLLLTLLLITTNSCYVFKQHIPLLQTENNMLYVTTELNGVLKIPFLIDSGASEVNVPFPVFYTMLLSGTVTIADKLDPKVYTLADGSEVKCQRFRIKSLKIGKTTLYNIEASISMNSDSPLILGQNVLSKLKIVSFDYKDSKMYID